MEGSNMEHESCVEGNLILDEASRSCRNKKKHSDPIYCPVCSITLRSSEIDAHLSSEMDKLYKISHTKHRANGKTNNPSTSSLNGINDNGKEWETYQKVRSNRHRRQKIKSRKRNLEEVICPVCNKETSEEINLHIEKCLQNPCQYNLDSEDTIDVEGDYEEYEWAGQSRVRATSFLSGGVSNLGTSLSITDEDEVLVVDGDDTNAYGSPQYSEQDIIICDSDREREALRKAVIGSEQGIQNNNESSSNSSCNESNIGDPILEALKIRVRELESQCAEDSYKCLICMERYKTPVISICCWHVHCEQCWLQTLGAKKLCPQCNMITSPTNLRRIYM